MTMKTLKQQAGVTIIELMIALVIGSIIMLGISTVYSSTKRSSIIQEEFSRMQENGRFALNYIARFVREAGFSGCASGLSTFTNTLNDTGENAWNFATGLEGYEANSTAPGETLATALDEYPSVSSTPANWTATTANTTVYAELVDGNADSVVPGSDILIARGMAGNGVEVTSNNSSAQVNVQWTGTGSSDCADGTNSESGICLGDILVISDCERSVAFQARTVQKTGSGSNAAVNITHDASGNPGNAITSWGGNSGTYPELTFAPGSELFDIETKTFYVGKGKNGPALFMRRGEGDGQELVEGVENMQILFGEDTDVASPDNIPDHYVPADKVADFGNVVSVRITLLLRTINNLPHRTAPAVNPTKVIGGMTSASGATIKLPKDTRVRKIMSMTIKLRNRAFSL